MRFYYDFIFEVDMENLYFEVNFEKYCKTCEYRELDEKNDPCCDCLDHGCNSQSEKPVNWKEIVK